VKRDQVASDDEDAFNDHPARTDEWEEFGGEDTEPIGIEELVGLKLTDMPEDVSIVVMDDFFPETTFWREGDVIVGEIQEHLYTKYWEHKFSVYAVLLQKSGKK